MSITEGRVADAVRGSWVDSRAPASWRPYLRLARADRPIGSWLLLLPCWWSAALAAIAAHQPLPNLWHMVLFAIGAVAMRGAGCTYNDLVDRDIDGLVERTRSRPLPAGQVTPRQAKLFLIAQVVVGALVLLALANPFAWGIGIASLGIVAIYPFMKRITSWPQSVLGLAFSWGALMGWAAAFGRLDLPAYLLYAGSILWVIGYDTIYAHQDREDDAIVGVKSTALLFGTRTPLMLGLFYGGAVLFFAAALWLVGGSVIAVLGLLVFALHLAWQIARLDIEDPDLCLRLFQSNRDAGLILLAGLMAEAALRALV
ncbi:4-hydroxybenzoate octaprenyltransferase [Phreatobacter aquaticus]|uniref:4-hydroxybenzoate octaprenyltransferase n=1 Tax=Phreatobacter aquaticus TaxID=2570229 RepID=A0A4D7QJD4_9HYPH|nr:4-hydroxybenzoate octaprenyltransferase [Phreatobacter aquaticus]QCK86023.1 4-hydroxybenzoate octaprenyltransferase [Phreatobacter aquaticus]